jgi:hypothetical protein
MLCSMLNCMSAHLPQREHWCEEYSGWATRHTVVAVVPARCQLVAACPASCQLSVHFLHAASQMLLSCKLPARCCFPASCQQPHKHCRLTCREENTGWATRRTGNARCCGGSFHSSLARMALQCSAQQTSYKSNKLIARYLHARSRHMRIILGSTQHCMQQVKLL